MTSDSKKGNCHSFSQFWITAGRKSILAIIIQQITIDVQFQNRLHKAVHIDAIDNEHKESLAKIEDLIEKFEHNDCCWQALT